MRKKHAGQDAGWFASGFRRENDPERRGLYGADRKEKKGISQEYSDGISGPFKFLFSANENRNVSV